MKKLFYIAIVIFLFAIIGCNNDTSSDSKVNNEEIVTEKNIINDTNHDQKNQETNQKQLDLTHNHEHTHTDDGESHSHEHIHTDDGESHSHSHDDDISKTH